MAEATEALRMALASAAEGYPAPSQTELRKVSGGAAGEAKRRHELTAARFRTLSAVKEQQANLLGLKRHYANASGNAVAAAVARVCRSTRALGEARGIGGTGGGKCPGDRGGGALGESDSDDDGGGRRNRMGSNDDDLDVDWRTSRSRSNDDGDVVGGLDGALPRRTASRTVGAASKGALGSASGLLPKRTSSKYSFLGGAHRSFGDGFLSGGAGRSFGVGMGIAVNGGGSGRSASGTGAAAKLPSMSPVEGAARLARAARSVQAGVAQ